MSGFLIAPFRLVKGENQWTEYRDMLPALQDAAMARAQDIWKGFKFGGVLPASKEYGITQFRPKDVLGGGTATWTQTFGSAGSWCRIFSYNVPEDMVHAIAGFAIPDPTLIFSQLRFQIEDRLYPIIDIEEAHTFGQGGFSLLIKQDKGKELIVAEELAVLVRGFQERGTRNRTQRVIPLGFMLYKNKDLVIREVETSGT